MQEDRTQHRLNLSAGASSVVVALALIALKLWGLSETGALTIAASLADNAVDLFASVAGLAAIFYAAKPPDEDHHFGHGSAEDLAVLAQSALLIVSALVITWQAIERLITPAPLVAEGLGLVIMAASALLTGALVVWQRWVAGQTGSRVVAADSLHYLSDLLPALGAMIALAASKYLGLFALDSIIALAASGMLLVAARHIGGGAWDALMDRSADEATIRKIEHVANTHRSIAGYHDLKTRMSGARVFVQIHIEIDGDLPLREAHTIGAHLKRRIVEAVPNADVIVHKDIARPH